MNEFSYQKISKRPADPAAPKSAARERSIPNSSYLDTLHTPEPDPAREGKLEARLRARQPVSPRRQAQILSAEAEADRLSESITSVTPEGVKAELGRKLGGDFSNVRMHTDSVSEAQAVALGARAFTAGNDVYFGTGGFDPGIAAHELVHTAQQGAVSGAAVAASAPMGGVQMWPWSKQKKDKSSSSPSRMDRFKGWLGGIGGAVSRGASRVGTAVSEGAHSAWDSVSTGARAAGGALSRGTSRVGKAVSKGAHSAWDSVSTGARAAGRAISRGADKAWDYTGGRLARWNRESIEEYTEGLGNGDWDEMSKWEKTKWMARNPLAWARAQRKSNRDAAAARRADYAADQREAEALVASSGGGTSSLIRGDVDSAEAEDEQGGSLLKRALHLGDTAVGLAGTAVGAAGTVSDVGEKIGKVSDKARHLTDASSVTDAFGTAGSVTGLAGTPFDLYDAFKEQREASKEGRTGDAWRTRAAMGATAVGAVGSGLGFASEAVSDIGGGVTGAVTGVINAGIGLSQAIGGGIQRRGAKRVQGDILQGGKKREDLASDDLLMHDIAVQGSMEGRRQEIEGSGKVISGALDAAGGIAGASGAGAVATVPIAVASAAVKGGTAIASGVQQRRTKSKVVEQTIGLSDDMIQRVMQARGLEDSAANRRRAKRAILRAHGYTTGTREELYRDQTVKRGRKLAQMATSARDTAEGARTGNDRHALSMMKAMGIRAKERDMVDTAAPGGKVKKTTFSEEGAIKSLGLSGGSEALDEFRTSRGRISAAAAKRRAKRSGTP